MTKFEGVDALRASCSPGTTLIDPIASDGSSLMVNGKPGAGVTRNRGRPGADCNSTIG